MTHNLAQNLLGLAAACLAVFANPALASTLTERTQCEAFESREKATVKYCVTLPSPEESPSKNVIVFFLHGFTESETFYRDEAQSEFLESELIRQGLRPIVVTPSFGELWILKESRRERSGSEMNALLDVFSNEFVPYIRERFSEAEEAFLVGRSMGGLNAALVYLKRPELFSKVVLLNPALSTLSPFNDSDSIEKYVHRTGAKRENAELILGMARATFVDREEYAKHDALRLAKSRQRNGRRLAPLHVQVSERNAYGFQEGSFIFAHELRLKGAAVDFELTSGGNDEETTEFRADAVARFLASELP